MHSRGHKEAVLSKNFLTSNCLCPSPSLWHHSNPVCVFCFGFFFCLRFASQGESVEENANVVVKLLIRRPECFGPALRGEGGQGLLAAMKEAIKISEDPALDLPKTPEGVTTGWESLPLTATSLFSSDLSRKTHMVISSD